MSFLKISICSSKSFIGQKCIRLHRLHKKHLSFGCILRQSQKGVNYLTVRQVFLMLEIEYLLPFSNFVFVIINISKHRHNGIFK